MRTFIGSHTHLHPELDYHAFCQCANENIGNFYDFIPRDGGRLAISFGDLPSTGDRAAISVPGMQALVRGLTAGSDADLTGLACELNRTLYLLGPRDLCAPWFYARVDPVQRELTYVNAGHEPPLLIRGLSQGRGWVERLERTGAALGLSVRGAHRQKTIAIEPAEVLAIFNEGLAERDVVDVVRHNPHAGASELVLRVWEAGDWPAGEDRTFAAVRVIGACRQPLRNECEVELHALCAA